MKVNRIVFWSHLAAGVAAGLVILMMSVTGVLLTYERQIVDWVEQGLRHDAGENGQPLSADELVGIARQVAPDAQQISITYKNEADALVKLAAGREVDLLVDPFSGEVVHVGETSTEAFFNTVMYLHRWFALSGDARAAGRAITGYSNLLFLFLLVSGIYLWLPRVWTWAVVRTKVFFNPKAKSGKARDFNWHHVFAFWSVVPLFFIITTASVFYFPWANEIVYGAFGEDPPERRRSSEVSERAVPAASAVSNQVLLQQAKAELSERGIDDWETISMRTATTPGDPATFRVDRSIGGQPAMVQNLTLDSADGSVLDWRTFADNTPGSRARSNIRFLHTGEVFGVLGQTIAGVASLAACFLVWTGLALAWRRLIRPFLGKRALRSAASEGGM